MPFHNHGGQNGSPRKPKTPPPQETSEEAAYLKMLGEKQKPVRIKLADGEVVEGWIEYYDKDIIRITRETQPNLFIYKNRVKYLYEDPASNGGRTREARA